MQKLGTFGHLNHNKTIFIDELTILRGKYKGNKEK